MEPMDVWHAFTTKLREGKLTAEDCVPNPCMNYAAILANPLWPGFTEWIADYDSPMVEHGETRLIFKLSTCPPHELRLDFEVDEDRWRFRTMDGLTLPVREIQTLPYESFPEYKPFEKNMRMEILISEKVRHYLAVKEKVGKAFALALFRDGAGYRVGADTWMPYFTLKKSFVVYTAWLERRLWEQDVAITAFSDERCALLIRDHSYLALYDITGHLRTQIAKDEYLELYEDAWRDRAAKVGWTVEFDYSGHNTTLVFE